MQPGRRMENLALIGFMGTGKSSVGQLVAAQLHFRFVDTDHLIEERAGTTITEIFARHGEAAFRDLERRVVGELSQAGGLVISTGGGLAAQPGNLDSLKQHALVVCLWASPEAILHRVGHQTHRPLLNCADPLARIRELLAAREPFYKQADVLMNTEMRSAREVAHQVVHQFQMARQNPSAR
jgi:shikimate kinase